MTEKQWAPAPGDGASEVTPGDQEPLGGAGADPDDEERAQRDRDETASTDAPVAGEAEPSAAEERAAGEGMVEETEGSQSGGKHAADVEPHAEDDDSGDSDDREEAEPAHEPDPANHDISAGEEFRQRGDWTADEAGGPQIIDADGNVVSEGGDGSPGDNGGGWSESDLDAVSDGGYSVGSAAPLDGDQMPLGHPVQAWEDSKTYAEPGHPSYSDTQPHVWFTDEAAAQRAGFTRAD